MLQAKKYRSCSIGSSNYTLSFVLKKQVSLNLTQLKQQGEHPSCHLSYQGVQLRYMGCPSNLKCKDALLFKVSIFQATACFLVTEMPTGFPSLIARPRNLSGWNWRQQNQGSWFFMPQRIYYKRIFGCLIQVSSEAIFVWMSQKAISKACWLPLFYLFFLSPMNQKTYVVSYGASSKKNDTLQMDDMIRSLNLLGNIIQQVFMSKSQSEWTEPGEIVPKEISERNQRQRTTRKYLVFLATLAFICYAVVIYHQTDFPQEWNERMTQSWLKEGEETVNDILQVGPIRAGELHYPRVPREYWEHRMLSIKALGLNALSVYVFWNLHEIKRGEFDFSSGQRDLSAFLTLAAKHGFKVLIRPGPYVCAEWDFGGLPARLLGIPNIKIRSHDPVYEAEVRIYFAALAEVIRPHLRINGGNIVLLQIQNQFGSLQADWRHTRELLYMWKQLNISCNFYNQDGYEYWRKNYLPGLSVGLSGGHRPGQYRELQRLKYFRGKHLVMGGQIYTGWLTHWREDKFKGLEMKKYTDHLQTLLSDSISFSLYMIHGGTNFGLTAGANEFVDKDYMAHITSYDYDAPINEQGSVNAKFVETKRLLEKYGITSSTKIPAPINTIVIPPIPLTLQATLMANLPTPIQLVSLQFFESEALGMYHQGIVIYETILPKQGFHDLEVMAHDYAMFFVDGEHAGEIVRRRYVNQSIKIQCKRESCVLQVLVEAMGHVNYGQMQRMDRKGLIHFSSADGTGFKWKAYRINLNNTALLDWRNKDEKASFPKILIGKFGLTRTGDTYFDLTPFFKGYVWVNGQLLGRYWNVGPQHSLFCPGVWLKEGENTIQLLEFGDVKETEIKTRTTLS